MAVSLEEEYSKSKGKSFLDKDAKKDPILKLKFDIVLDVLQTKMAEAIFAGEPGAPRDIVLINSALALMAAGKASGYKEGAALAAESIDSGAAKLKLINLRRV